MTLGEVSGARWANSGSGVCAQCGSGPCLSATSPARATAPPLQLATWTFSWPVQVWRGSRSPSPCPIVPQPPLGHFTSSPDPCNCAKHSQATQGPCAAGRRLAPALTLAPGAGRPPAPGAGPLSLPRPRVGVGCCHSPLGPGTHLSSFSGQVGAPAEPVARGHGLPQWVGVNPSAGRLWSLIKAPLAKTLRLDTTKNKYQRTFEELDTSIASREPSPRNDSTI